MKPTLRQADLAQFTGTEQYYYFPLYPKMNYTDGVKYLLETAGAYWLLDIIGTEYFPKQQAGKWDYLVVIKMHVEDSAMQIVVTDGNNKKYLTRDIPFTDFPPGDWSLWLVEGVLILPSEY